MQISQLTKSAIASLVCSRIGCFQWHSCHLHPRCAGHTRRDFEPCYGLSHNTCPLIVDTGIGLRSGFPNSRICHAKCCSRFLKGKQGRR
jgi:hypothetical protein